MATNVWPTSRALRRLPARLAPTDMSWTLGTPSASDVKQIPAVVPSAKVWMNWMSAGNVCLVTHWTLPRENASGASRSVRSACRMSQASVSLVQMDSSWSWTVSKKKQEFVQLVHRTARPANTRAPAV